MEGLRREPVSGPGQHLAVTDQETHRFAGVALERCWWIEALHPHPEAIAAQEGQITAALEVQRVGDEGAASPGQLRHLSWWRLIGQGKEAAAGDVIHQVSPQAARAIRQAPALVRFAGVKQDPHALERGGTEHHQSGPGAVANAAESIEKNHPIGEPAPADLHMAHHRIAAQADPARFPGHGPGRHPGSRNGARDCWPCASAAGSRASGSGAGPARGRSRHPGAPRRE